MEEIEPEEEEEEEEVELVDEEEIEEPALVVEDEEEAIEVEEVEEVEEEEIEEEVEPELDEEEAVEEEVAAPEPEAPAPSAAEAKDFSEDLEEADFYVQQGLADEARRVYQSILDRDPDHEVATAKLAELDAEAAEEEEVEEVVISEGEPPVAYDEAPAEESPSVIVPEPPEAAAPEPEPAAPPAPKPKPPAAPKPKPSAAPKPKPPAAAKPKPPAAPKPKPPAAPKPKPPAAPKPPPPPPKAPAPPPPPAEPAQTFSMDDLGPEDPIEQPAAGFFTGPAAPADDDLFAGGGEESGLFDLAAELEQDKDFLSSLDTDMGASEDFSIDETLQAFKKGVAQQISEHDAETHYNLGIAYKEMGLIDDALQEFMTASRDPARYADCMQTSAIILRENGDLDKAIETCKMALSFQEADDKTRAAGYLELSEELIGKGEKGQARWAVDQAKELDPSHPELERMQGELADVDPVPVKLEKAASPIAPQPEVAPPPAPDPAERQTGAPVETGPPPSREQTTWQKAALEQQPEDGEETEKDKAKKKKQRKKISYV